MNEEEAQPAFHGFLNRILRACKLDVHLYEEVEADQNATGQALAVVVLSSLAAGFGTIGQAGGYGHILVATLWAVFLWVIWAAITYWVGTRLLPEEQTQADLGQLLRTVGFSSAPGLIQVLGILPGFVYIVFPIASVWMLVAMVIAVRQALDYQSTWRAIGVCLIGWVIRALILVPVVLLTA